MESVDAINIVIDASVIFSRFHFLLLFGLFRCLLICLVLLTNNHLTSTLRFLFPTFLSLQIYLFSLKIRFISILIFLDVLRFEVLAIFDHELTALDSLPIWVPVNECFPLFVKFLLPLLLSFLSLLLLLLSLLLSFLSLFKLFLLLFIFLLPLFLSLLIFLLYLSLVILLILDILDVSQKILLVLPSIEIFVVFYF